VQQNLINYCCKSETKMKTILNQIKYLIKDTTSDIYQSPEINSRKQKTTQCIWSWE